MWLLRVSDIKNITSPQNYKDTNPCHTRYQVQYLHYSFPWQL